MQSRIPKLLLISFLLFVFSAFVAMDALFSPFARKEQRVEIENFCGHSYEELSFPDWLDVKVEYSHDEGTPEGIVLSQTPTGGSRRLLTKESPNCELKLTVSLGEKTAILPNLLGKDAREAESTLRALGFATRLERTHGAYPAGEVFELSPPVGTELPVGSTVTLHVSAGQPSKSVKVPNVCGLSREDALVALWMAELRVAEVIEEAAPQDAGIVFRQSLQAGTLVPAGSAVTLYVYAEPTW